MCPPYSARIKPAKKIKLVLDQLNSSIAMVACGQNRDEQDEEDTRETISYEEGSNKGPGRQETGRRSAPG